ncbi:tRNA pseudouridine(55) synthase TruB [Cellvibrio japonicus]|uniref:tRNA pseudouridine synthase B n=1 Tax=Cellvibrio japonicus (strain Ueda107) TaxID=498211 RepID=B3PI98_CELJU|nr:tRNA pseudouridine(55) synthase TruB [Cellvibrio japonicus]ACE85191.1 tRNA pseudouridine synthase B [Cellvibrio japonicus Ueda107]QEI11140.1 tRNA pseudouridine(55) synthase TruB [Cellvibrio japonicus]QEI14714.1 tRNA pseudouridine(55) synthase TruB [Cellvibrio japonicus]QEI18294.1 tRNA pseudouridine(55) synthase TruB [Cellvibrio japonicus]
MAKRKGRPVDGVLLLHKPAGMTSNQALQRAKRLFFAEKAGHTGSLDPLATGVLPLCFGEATKFSQFLLDADKGYRTCIRLGITTDTCDADGDVLETRSAAAITRAQLDSALDAFRGNILQVPPMYSALKLNGQPLYKIARQGVEVEREPRAVTIHSLDVLAFRPGEVAEVELDIRCSKGTYIRSIAEDLGRALGCGAHVKVLHRSLAGSFGEDQCIGLEQLEADYERGGYDALDAHLVSADAPVASLPAVDLPANSAYYFRQGNPVMDTKVYRIARQGDIVRVFCAESAQSPRQFLGLGEITDDGRVAPKRIIANRSAG